MVHLSTELRALEAETFEIQDVVLGELALSEPVESCVSTSCSAYCSSGAPCSCSCITSCS